MSLAAARVRARPLLSGRAGFLALVLVYALLIVACLGTLAREGELSLGRSPIATLGSLLGALLVLPLAAPRPLAWGAKAVLDTCRSIHTLVFGLVLVGIVGLGPTAGILAIGLHSMGTYGKLFAEAIESLDMAAIEAVRSVGAGPAQVFFNAVWPTVLPQFVSSHLYIWEFNIRDSTILGLIGAGGLELLITEATAALDPAAAQEICRVLGTATAGATLVSVVHNTALLPLLAERVIGLRQGRIVFDLPRSQLDAAQLAALYGGPSAPMRHRVDGHFKRRQHTCLHTDASAGRSPCH